MSYNSYINFRLKIIQQLMNALTVSNKSVYVGISETKLFTVDIRMC